MSTNDFLKAAKNVVERLFFPSDCVCIVCGRESVTDENGLCKECSVFISEPDAADDILSGNPFLDGISIVSKYRNGLGGSVVRLKYRSQSYLAERLANLLESDPEWGADLVTCVPMHPWREHMRGYNHSALLAESFAKHEGIPFEKYVLHKAKLTGTQVGKDRQSRKELPKGTFRAEKSLCEGKRIIIIDDVCTTGTTLNECARVMKECGAVAVYGLVLAHG